MKKETKEAKKCIRDMAPQIARERIEKYKIPSPYKEVLIHVCVERKNMFAAENSLREIGLNVSQRTLSRLLHDGLEMFSKSDGGKTAKSWQELSLF